MIAGLPERGYLVLETAERQGEPRVLLQEYLDRSPRAGVRRVEVDLDGLASGSLWGALPDLAARSSTCLDPSPASASVAVRYRRSDDAGQGYRTAFFAPESGHWSFTGPAGTYDVWCEVGGVRVSSVLAAELVPATATGPLRLDARSDTRSLRVAWESAPDAELALAVHDTGGAALFRSSGRLGSPGGECFLDLPADDVGSIEAVLHDDGYAVVRRIQARDPSLPVQLDLCGDEPVSLELRASSLRVAKAELRLVRVESSEADELLMASCRIEDGCSGPIPLPPGLYYYRVEAEPLDGLVCGLVRLDGARVPHAIVDWHGVPTSFDADAQLSWRGRLRVESIEGLPLGARVPECFRDFELDDSVLRDGVLANSQGCAWVLR